MGPTAAVRAGHVALLALLAAFAWLLAALGALGALPGAPGPWGLAAGTESALADDDAMPTGPSLPGAVVPSPDLPGAAGAAVPPVSVHAAPTPPVPPTPQGSTAGLPPAVSDGPPVELDRASAAVDDDVPAAQRGSAPGRGPPAGIGT